MTPTEIPEAAGPSARRLGWIPAVAAVLSIVVIVAMGLGWDALARPGTYRGKKNDYYSLLVHGFLSGHLYMDLAADPRLESPDPVVRENAPSALDASYFQRRYYLYFGVTPAAAILLPYAWVTGSDLDPRVVVVLGVAAGFLFALWTWRMAAQDAFPGMGGASQAASAAALAFATATPLLLTRAMFYEVAIAAGYACVMAGFFWIYRAMSGRGRPCVQLAWASLALGLAVGCRPDLVLMLPALALAALLATARGSDSRPVSGGILRNGAAAMIPAGCVGAGLALYNYERFGSPLDFGFKYGMNGFIFHHFRLASATYLWPNLHWYYLTLPAIGPYFPYVFPCRAEFGPPGYQTGETIHGQFPVFVLTAFVALSAILCLRRLSIGRLAGFLCALGVAFVPVFVALSTLGIRADRYMVDFQAPLVLAVVLLAGAVGACQVRGAASRLWRAGFVALALLAAAFNIFAGLEEFDSFKNLRTETFAAMEAVGNIPSAWLERLGLLRYGPVVLKVMFPRDVASPSSEPLLTLGTPQFTDSLYVNRYPGNWIEFMGGHLRYPEPRSAIMQMQPGRVYTLRVEMGAMYPPLNHPFFLRYDKFQSRRMKSEIHVEMDGRRILDSKMGSYNAPPWTLEVGRNDISMSPAKMFFDGQVTLAERLPPPVPKAAADSDGLWRIRCVFPVQYPGDAYPVLSSGITANGTLVYVTMLPGNRIQFGIDEWGYGGGRSSPLDVVPLSEHTVEIFIGTLAVRARWPKEWHVAADQLQLSASVMRVWLDGRLVQTQKLFAPFNSMAALIDVGANVQGFSSSSPAFFGPIQEDPFSGDEIREFLERNLQAKP
jgi:hypothetical protein